MIDSQTAKGLDCDTSSAWASIVDHSFAWTARTSLSNRDLPNPALAIDGYDATRVANVKFFAVGFVTEYSEPARLSPGPHLTPS